MAVESFIAAGQAAGGGGGGPAASLVYQPGGTAGGNVYTTWASLYAAAQEVAPGLVDVLLDTRFNVDIYCQVTGPGPYDLANMRIWPYPILIGYAEPALAFEDGVFCTELPFEVGCTLINRGTTTPFVVTSVRTFTAKSRASFQAASGSPPLIDVQGGFLWLTMSDETSLPSPVIPPPPSPLDAAIKLTGGFLYMVLNDKAEHGQQSIDSDVSGTVFCEVASLAVRSFDETVFNPNFLGSWTTSYRSNPNELVYSAVPSIWASPLPTSVQRAIDRLAAGFFSNHGPVPF